MSTTPIQNSILLVEDESSLRAALSDKFKREGFLVYEAKDGDVGLTLANAHHPDVILLDVMMPKTDGITMLHLLRQDSEWGKGVPVLLLTNVSSDDKRMLTEVAEDLHVSYLVKSDWSITMLVTRVREVLAQTL